MEKSEIFSKFRPWKEIIRKFDQNRNFSKIRNNWTFSEIFENFDQNRNFFDNLTEIPILRNLWKFCKKVKFFENLTKIASFFFEWNPNFSKVRKKSKFFVNCDQNRNFFENLTKIIILKNLTKIEILKIFWNFWNILTRIDIFGRN